MGNALHWQKKPPTFKIVQHYFVHATHFRQCVQHHRFVWNTIWGVCPILFQECMQHHSRRAANHTSYLSILVCHQIFQAFKRYAKKVRKLATKIASRQNSVNQYLFYWRILLIEIAHMVFCLAYLVFWLAYFVFCLAHLVFLFGVHYIFLAYIIFILFGVIGVCGVGMLYLLHLEFGMVHLIFSSQKIVQICVFSL